MIINFVKKRQINFFSRVRATKYLQLFDSVGSDKVLRVFLALPYSAFKTMDAGWPLPLQSFIFKEKRAAAALFVGELGSFNYLNFDVRSLLIKYRCFVKSTGDIPYILYQVASLAGWFFFLSFLIFTCFILFFLFYVGMKDAEVLMNTWFFFEGAAFSHYWGGLLSWLFFLIFRLSEIKLSGLLIFNTPLLWDAFTNWWFAYLNFFFVGWESSMSSFEFFVNTAAWLAENKIWVGLFFTGVVCFILAVFVFGIFYGFLRTDLWILALKWLYGNDYTRGVLSIEALNQAGGRKFDNKVLWSSFRANSSNYQELYFDFLQNQTFGGFVGFVDLFPTYDSVFSYSNFLSKRFRGRYFNRGLASIVVQRWSLSVNARNYLRRRLNFLNFQPLKSTRLKAWVSFWKSSSKISFISNRFYAIPRIQLAANFFWGFNVLRFFKNVSVGGEFNIQELRNRLFLALTKKKDPWFSAVSGSNLQEFRSSSSKDLTNWYARELNSVVLSRTLRHNISFSNNSSLSRFRFGWQNLVNDYSFWRVPTNEHNTFEHFDVFFSMPEEEDYAGESHIVRVGDVLDEAEINEEDPEEYIDESAEMFFEDGLLHKSLDSILFDDEVVEALGDVGLSDTKVDGFEDEEFVDFLNNQGVVYKAGQEADYSVTTSSKEYSGIYGLEYNQPKAYLEQVFSSFYDELVDLYWLGGFKTFYLNLFECPSSRVLGVWPFAKIFKLKRISRRVRVGRLLEFYRQQSMSLFVPRYDKLMVNLFITFFFFVFAWGFIFFCFTGLLLGSSAELVFDLYLIFFWVAVVLVLFAAVVAILIVGRFFYGTFLTFFFITETSLVLLGYFLGLILGWTSSRNFRGGSKDLIFNISGVASDISIFSAVSRYGFVSKSIRFFFKSFLFKKLVLTKNGVSVFRYKLLALLGESFLIDVVIGLHTFRLGGGLPLHFAVSNNCVLTEYSFLFVNFTELRLPIAYFYLRQKGAAAGINLSAFDFYYLENSMLRLREKFLFTPGGDLAFGGSGLLGRAVFGDVDRVVGKLQFTSSTSRFVDTSPEFLEKFGSSNSPASTSLWRSNLKSDMYTGAFLFFSSVEWTKALWGADYGFSFENFSEEAGPSVCSNDQVGVAEHNGLAANFAKSRFLRTQKFNFLGLNLPHVTERFRKTEGRELVRLFLANRVMSANYTNKSLSEGSSLFETLFYASFFEVRVIDKFYVNKAKL